MNYVNNYWRLALKSHMTRVKIPELKNIKIETLDLGQTTLDDYLKELLKAIWMNGEDFKSKRPFGKEGWKWEINTALVEKYPSLGKLVKGFLWNVNEKLDKAVVARIEKIFQLAQEYESLKKNNKLDC